MSTIAGKNKHQSQITYFVKLAIGLFLLFGFGYVCPAWGGISLAGIQSIGIFFGLVFLISCSDFGLILPALLGFIALVATDAYDPKTLIAATFGNTTVVQIIFAYVLCQVLIDTGAGEFIANWLLSRKILRGRPYLFCFVFFLVAFLMGAFGHIGGIIFVLTLLDSVVGELGYDIEGKFNRWMSLGTFTSACMGMGLIPFQGLPLVIFGTIMTAMQESGIALNYAVYMLSVIIFSLLFILLFSLAVKFGRIDVQKLSTFDITKTEGFDASKTKMNRKQLLACICFLFGIGYSIITPFLSKDSALMQFLSNFDQCTWFILALALFFLFRKDGQAVLNEEKTFRTSISWSIILVICIFSVVGGMMASPDFGVRAWLGQVLAPVFTGMPFPLFMLLICVVAGICTNFLSNAVVGVIVGTITMPFAITYSQTIGINLSIYGATVTMASMFCFLTMVAAGYTPLFLTRPCIKKSQKFVWCAGGGTLLGAIVLLAAVNTILAYIL